MSSVTQTDDAAAKTSRILWALGLVLLLAGWLSVLQVYRWHFTAPVFFLGAGWAALLATARFLYRAATTAAEDTGDVVDDFWKPMGRREELLLEKRSLLKAIKEIEFDREMGKMSESDAADLTRFYRHRAIEIIKALESEGEAGESLSVQEQIEREIKARLVVAGAGAQKKAKQKAGQKAGQKAEEKAGQKANQTADEPAGRKAEQKQVGEDRVAAGADRAADAVTGAAADIDRAASVAAGSEKAGGEPADNDEAAGKAVAGEQAGPVQRPAAEDAS